MQQQWHRQQRMFATCNTTRPLVSPLIRRSIGHSISRLTSHCCLCGPHPRSARQLETNKMVALKLSSMRGAEVASSSSRCQRACVARPSMGSSSRRSVALRAAADDGAVSTSSPPVLVWPQDNETARDIFSFAGPLPERLNGRMAMLGFAGVALAEIKSGIPAAEQLGGDVAGVLLLSATLTLASIFPKFVSGSSLKDLHAAATSANLKASSGIGQVLGLFDQNLELWTGRVAMLGFAGLLVVEGVTGKVLL